MRESSPLSALSGGFLEAPDDGFLKPAPQDGRLATSMEGFCPATNRCFWVAALGVTEAMGRGVQWAELEQLGLLVARLNVAPWLEALLAPGIGSDAFTAWLTGKNTAPPLCSR